MIQNNLSIEGLAPQLKVERTREFIDKGGAQEKIGESGKSSFLQLLKDGIDQTNALQIESDNAAKELVAGRTKNPHEAMLTMERADIALKLMMQVRNKLLDAYRKIMRMQV